MFDRFQALAEPNTIVIGQNTRLIVGNLFEYRDLGAIELKGFSEPVQAYQPRRSSSPESAGGELFDIIGYVADKFASGSSPGG